MPLARALSKLGFMSRSQAIERILAGGVRVSGHVVRDPGYAVVPETARITVDGNTVGRALPLTILLHKPRGVVTTRSDPQGRPTMYDLVKEVGTYVSPVGRLDLASTGLLLLTNDTRLADWLLDPANRIPRTYIVAVRGEFGDDAAARIARGIRDRGELLQATNVEVLKRSRRETHVRVQLMEGKNRELRRLFRACGHDVTRLKRVAFGALTLGMLGPGRWRIVPAGEPREALPGAPLRTSPKSKGPDSRAR